MYSNIGVSFHETVPLRSILYCFKGTVQRDGGGYKSGINGKVFLNPITAEAYTFFCFVKRLKFTFEDLGAVPSISFEKALSFQIAVFFQSPQFGIRNLTLRIFLLSIGVSN